MRNGSIRYVYNLKENKDEISYRLLIYPNVMCNESNISYQMEVFYSKPEERWIKIPKDLEEGIYYEDNKGKWIEVDGEKYRLEFVDSTCLEIHEYSIVGKEMKDPELLDSFLKKEMEEFMNEHGGRMVYVGLKTSNVFAVVAYKVVKAR